MVENIVKSIAGRAAKNHREHIRFVNDFDMAQVRRFYIIQNTDKGLARDGWADRMEQRWFYVLSDSIAADLIQSDNWGNTSPELPIEKRILKVEEQQILHVPVGYATEFQALELESELLMFNDYEIDNAKGDYTWSQNFAINRTIRDNS